MKKAHSEYDDLDTKKTKKNDLEKIDWKLFGPNPVIGVDEVGRGCLAGPVYAAACVLLSDELTEVMTDSKLIKEKNRSVIAEKIQAKHRVAIGFATVEEIEKLNILNAALLAMKRAVENLELTHGHVLVDGNRKIPDLSHQFQQTTIVKGDLRVAPISAASIVAKVTRDQVMYELDKEFPQYQFAVHKGYATPIHRKAIQEFGPTAIHRKTFGGVKEYLLGTPSR